MSDWNDALPFRLHLAQEHGVPLCVADTELTTAEIQAKYANARVEDLLINPRPFHVPRAYRRKEPSS